MSLATVGDRLTDESDLPTQSSRYRNRHNASGRIDCFHWLRRPGGDDLLYEFTGRRAAAIWLSWTFSSAVAWLAVHPSGTDLRLDAVMLLAGGALAAVFHGFILWSRTLGQDVRLAWWVASLVAWAIAVTTGLLLPWDEVRAVEHSGLPFVFFIAASGLLVGAAQSWALAGMHRAKSWIPIPAIALVVALFASASMASGLQQRSWLEVFQQDVDSAARLEGFLFGGVYGALTGAAFVWVGRGERARLAGRPPSVIWPAPNFDTVLDDLDTPTTDTLKEA